MIYKNHKDVYLTVSARYDLDFDLVRLIGDFYWADISNNIEKFKHRELYVNKLGSFRFRKKESLDYLSKADRIELMMRSNNRSEEAIEETLTNLMYMKERMEILSQEWEDIRLEYHKYKEKKYAYRDFQKQKADMGRIEESNI